MCCPCFLIFFGFVFLSSGGSLIAVFEEELEVAKALDPEKDFQFLGEVCETGSVTSTEKNQEVCVRHNNGNNNECSEWETACFDTYSHMVSYAGSEYLVREMDFQRKGEARPCSSNQEKNPDYPWQIGEDLQCWKSAGNINPDDIHDVFECMNDICLKVNDPADDQANRILELQTLIGVFEGMCVLGFLMLCCACCACVRVFQGKRY